MASEYVSSMFASLVNVSSPVKGDLTIDISALLQKRFPNDFTDMKPVLDDFLREKGVIISNDWTIDSVAKRYFSIKDNYSPLSQLPVKPY
ncbi:MAG TPA: hypothetical protein VI790_03045 [Candidatus Nanoarchaeia archaeon]|nr:hypothetical protein [Candidatus Nanoarchaeia archaeon]